MSWTVLHHDLVPPSSYVPLKDRKTERQEDRNTERQKDRNTERQKDREIEKQKDRKKM